jgi:drug/metabolite transporter (DMT)-like permease
MARLVVSAAAANPLTGIALKIASTLAFSAMMATIKVLGDAYPVGQVVFFRSAFALLPILALLFWTGAGLRGLQTKRPGAHALRSIAGTAAMFSGFGGLMLLPIADATAISFAAPIVTVVLSAIILSEPVRLFRWSAVAVGFAGVMLMLSPHWDPNAGRPALGAALSLTGAVCAAFAVIFIQRMKHDESGAAIAFYFQATCTLAGLCTAPFGWTAPSFSDGVLLVMTGVLGGLGQLLMTHSYNHAPASTIANFDYVAMLWALAFGYFFFQEWPQAVVLMGAAIVIASGAFIVWRERRLHRAISILRSD